MRSLANPWVALLLATGSFAQSPQPVAGARELYYFGAGGKDTLPSLQKVAAASGRSQAAQVRQTASNTPRRKSTEPVPEPQADPAAVHLGLRYNLLLVNAATGRAEPVDSDRNFRNGECLAIEFDANRSGYLYVLAKQSDGDWRPLLPSPEMSNEPNVIDPGQKLRAPHGYCFEISDPPGNETIFVVLSRDPRDFFELYQGIKNQPAQDATPPPSQPTRNAPPLQMASAGSVSNAVSKMAGQFGTRNLVIRKVTASADPKEAPGTVYVVNASDKPAATISTQFQIKHR